MLEFKINAAPINSATATLSANSYTYNGFAKKPAVTVKLGSKKLVNNTDYTVSYKNNTNIGTATVTITGKGNYTGTLNKAFKINAIPISSTTASLSTGSYTYNGFAKKPAVTVKLGSKKLVNNTDYTVSYLY